MHILAGNTDSSLQRKSAKSTRFLTMEAAFPRSQHKTEPALPRLIQSDQLCKSEGDFPVSFIDVFPLQE
jgi:hypothetical protein